MRNRKYNIWKLIVIVVIAVFIISSSVYIFASTRIPYIKNNNGSNENKDINLSNKLPKEKVEVNLEIEKADQEKVDNGHSPWRLDPIHTVMTFVGLKIYPNGIIGQFPVGENNIKVIEETNTTAVVEVKGDISPISRVYLERLVRKDKTGIWSVVGYDLK